MIENATFENVYAAVCPVSWAVCVCVCVRFERIYLLYRYHYRNVCVLM